MANHYLEIFSTIMMSHVNMLSLKLVWVNNLESNKTEQQLVADKFRVKQEHKQNNNLLQISLESNKNINRTTTCLQISLESNKNINRTTTCLQISLESNKNINRTTTCCR